MQYLCCLLMLLGVYKVPLQPFTADAVRQDENAPVVPHRVYDSSKSRGVDFEEMVTKLAGADIVIVGEQHDSAPTHRLERAILEGLSRKRSVILSLEMFERDVQPSLNSYLSGQMQEADFLKISRPWPAYASSYKPLVALALENRWPVIAANVPRKYASQVARSGLPAIDSLSAAERELVASKVACPHDGYFKRFQQEMGSHPSHPSQSGAAGGSSVKSAMSDDPALMERIYAAQCLKDETMAESIANAWSGAASPKPLVIHFTGAFHSDFRQGTVARVHQRLKDRRIRVVSIIPVTNLDQTKADEQRKRADYLVFTIGSPAN
jgi:uncharacterized iron-regulated protein